MDLREQILGANDRRCVPVECPEWGCTVYVYNMTAGDRMRVDRAFAKGDTDSLNSFMVYLCACDESGTRIFSEKDIPALQNKNGAVVERIIAAAMSLNKIDISPEALAEKNSETIPVGSSGTD